MSFAFFVGVLLFFINMLDNNQGHDSMSLIKEKGEKTMEVGSKEHYDLMLQFEKDVRGVRFDRESRELWGKGIIYQHGEVNNLFIAYRKGYSYGKSIQENGIY